MVALAAGIACFLLYLLFGRGSREVRSCEPSGPCWLGAALLQYRLCIDLSMLPVQNNMSGNAGAERCASLHEC